MEGTSLTPFPGKAWHVLLSSVSGCCFLIDCRFLGYFCQSTRPFDVAISWVNWSRILLNANTWTTRWAMWVYYNFIVERLLYWLRFTNRGQSLFADCYLRGPLQLITNRGQSLFTVVCANAMYVILCMFTYTKILVLRRKYVSHQWKNAQSPPSWTQPSRPSNPLATSLPCT